MPNVDLLTVLGSGLVLVVMVDFLITTVSLRQSEPIASMAAKTTGRFMRRLPPPVAAWSGSAALVTMTSAWILLLWLGWVLIFFTTTARLVGPDDTPVRLLDVIAFAGSTLTTMGLGVVTPTAGSVHIATVVTSITGMVVLTLSVSFILNVSQIAVSARTMALRCNDILALLKDLSPSAGMEMLLDQAASLAADIHSLAESRESFPLSREYDPVDRERNVATSARDLVEAIHHRLEDMSEGDYSRKLGKLADTIARLSA